MNFLLKYFIQTINKDNANTTTNNISNYRVFIDFVPKIYKYENLDLNFDFTEDLISFDKNGYIAISYSLIKNYYNFTRLFFKTLFNQYLNKSNYEDKSNSYTKKDDKINKEYFVAPKIDRIDNPIKLNSFFSSFIKINTENIKEIYSEFASYYFIKKLEIEQKEYFDRIYKSLEIFEEEKITYEFYQYLINIYKYYYEITGKVKFFNELDFFYRFIDEQFNKNRYKIIKKIIYSSKFLIYNETTENE